MYDSPMEQCPVCGVMVTLDQSFTECREKHACAEDQVCPLRKYFIGVDSVSAPGQKEPEPPVR